MTRHHHALITLINISRKEEEARGTLPAGKEFSRRGLTLLFPFSGFDRFDFDLGESHDSQLVYANKTYFFFHHQQRLFFVQENSRSRVNHAKGVVKDVGSDNRICKASRDRIHPPPLPEFLGSRNILWRVTFSQRRASIFYRSLRELM